ncbi:sulfite exporter TauE/SafE family protein [Calditerrivibrio nitroreducens]|uniref:Urease accessory protein UreH-like transmembrane domain-containing protein n=1 Tax=Calditerrivibrio nitroreducens (strain DSM 19672 / NBRC 101217 / Yu37-1) TaxID=768670 RepID=E4TGX7_CALNY|nr:sulfite exporter TauE/SafE family protein [Calditerrivibrio nitroreducens]ADR18737.1 hypothetical protein Calni_0826 [Calditerrivibrio nitroreducens DSM 19672]
MYELIGFFSLGFFGGFGHCIFMCNPFVLYVASRFAPNNPGYINYLIPQIKYNSGRILTYTFLGFLFGSISNISELFSGIINFQKLLSISAGIFLILYATFDIWGFKIISKLENNYLTHIIRDLISKFKFSSPFLTGVVLGFLPCGLLYGALIGVSSLNNAIKSAVSMSLFGLGSSISLIVIAVFGNILLKYRKIFRIISFLIMSGMGIFFIVSGIKF